MHAITRRSLLQSTALTACAGCTCLANGSKDCCTLPEAPSGAIRIEPGMITIDLAQTPDIRQTGSAVKVIAPEHKVQIVVVHPAKDQFLALDQRCTHGGGALTYVHKHKHLYCTCWGHAKFALDGAVLRWPNKQPPRPLRTHAVERKGNLLVIRVEGMA